MLRTHESIHNNVMQPLLATATAAAAAAISTNDRYEK